MIFVDSYDCSRLSETFKHTVRPTTVTVLQMLDDFQLEIDVDLEIKLLDLSINSQRFKFHKNVVF